MADRTVEFTGERVIPGKVDPDLFNEHLARYAFAARLARRKRVLDAGCGTGYGSAELALVAQEVLGVDLAGEAIAYAREHYGDIPNVRFEQGSCAALPSADGAVDLLVAFEVIEHLADWRAFLAEAVRVLSPSGQFLVSTPNKHVYSESRRVAGPNPFHVHEFGFDEFRAELGAVFPHVSLFLENHAGGVVFQPLQPSRAIEARTEALAAQPLESNFFVAVCAMRPQTGAPTFFYMPAAGNLLRDRERHIGLLEEELAAKNAWLEKATADLSGLQDSHHALLEEHTRMGAEFKEVVQDLERQLEQANRWAEGASQQVRERDGRIVELQEELASQQSGYEAKISGLSAEMARISEWAHDVERTLNDELAKCNAWAQDVEKKLTEELVKRTAWAEEVESRLTEELVKRTAWAEEVETRLTAELEGRTSELQQALKSWSDEQEASEALLAERTAWAKRLDEEAAALRAELTAIRASRWVKLGGRLRVGPLS